ncbi:hypothetical protein D3C86_1236220 [compost metagenome]
MDGDAYHRPLHSNAEQKDENKTRGAVQWNRPGNGHAAGRERPGDGRDGEGGRRRRQQAPPQSLPCRGSVRAHPFRPRSDRRDALCAPARHLPCRSAQGAACAGRADQHHDAGHALTALYVGGLHGRCLLCGCQQWRLARGSPAAGPGRQAAARRSARQDPRRAAGRCRARGEGGQDRPGAGPQADQRQYLRGVGQGWRAVCDQSLRGPRLWADRSEAPGSRHQAIADDRSQGPPDRARECRRRDAEYDV